MTRARYPNDDSLDRALRDVPVPEDLIRRLKQIPAAVEAEAAPGEARAGELRVVSADESPESAGDGAGAAALLRQVDVPPGLVDRLAQIPDSPEAEWSDRELDTHLRSVALPSGLLARLTRIAEPVRHGTSWRQAAAAAVLVVLVGLSYVGSVAGLVASIRPPRLQPTMPVDSGTTSGFVEEEEQRAAEGALAIGFEAIDQGPGASENRAFARLVHDAERAIVPPLAPEGSGGFADRFWTRLLDGRQVQGLFVELNEYRWGEPLTFPADRSADDLPQIQELPIVEPQGLAPPNLPWFKQLVWTTGVHPLVPAKEVPRSIVPLAPARTSYDLVRRMAAERKLPEPGDVRVEQFLAAFDYGLIPPTDAMLGLRTAAGPSPFRPDGWQMLQVGVKAREPAARQRPPTHLAVAVDVSASMEWYGRLDFVRKALADVAERLGPEDRISVVAFDEQAYVLAERVAPGDVAEIRRALDHLQAQGPTNVGAGLQRAYAVAGEGTNDDRRRKRVVLVSDGLSVLDARTTQRIEEALAVAAEEGLRLDVVNIGPTGRDDAWLERLAGSGGGRLRRAARADQLRWALLESLTGTPQTVASSVRLTVQFDPEAVEAYRLLGHEGPLTREPVNPQTDMRTGQAATGLYELRLKDSSSEVVGWAEVTWLDPETREPQTVRRRITRRQFAPTFRESAMSLQLAVLVAQTAEILRESPFAQASTLEDVRRLAGDVAPVLARTEEFAEFRSLVEAADRARK